MKAIRCIVCVLPFAVVALNAGRAPAQESINLRRTVTVEIFERSKDAVVNISASKLVNRRINPFGGDPFWQHFDFGQMRKIPANSLGSGFLVHPEGYVVTNHHVIDRAREITIELADGRQLPAELISSDAEADLAILKISGNDSFPALPLGDCSDLLVGEPVIAVGNPLGFSHTVSTGIVSATQRDLRDPRDRIILGDLIQTDAAINPGNSGGPLLNAYGQVIGINTAIRGDAQNIGFAIQVNKLRDLIPDLMNPAQVNKLDVPVRLRERRTAQPPAGVNVRIELDDADLAEPRIVSEIDGQRPHDIIDAYAILLKATAERDVRIRLDGGETLSIRPRPVPQPDAIVQARSRLGVLVEPLTPLLAQRYHLPTEDGMLVKEVTRNSPAAAAGIQPGDVIISLGRYQVRTLSDFSTLMQVMPQGGQVRVGVIRGNQVGYGMIELRDQN